jgi:predicted dehydrogenase
LPDGLITTSFAMNKQTGSSTQRSRRNFLKETTLAAAGLMIVPRHVLGGPGFIPPSDKVNIALVGAGGRGKENARALMGLEDVQLTAIADPGIYWDLDRFYYRTVAGRGPVKEMIQKHYAAQNPQYKVAEYEDFRLMLEQESDLDAVLCATPDHTHAYISLLSLRAGKHVYCEKPLTHNIWEAREVQRVARETGLATQMGNQLHSSDGLRQTVEHLKAGTIGKISEVHVWVSASRWDPTIQKAPTGINDLPFGLNWDLWLGPRPLRHFHPSYAPVTWRDYWEFGCGAMGDFGCHDLDPVVWGLDLGAPEQVILYPAGHSDEYLVPFGEVGYYQFPRKNRNTPLKVNWYSGGLKPGLSADMPADTELSPLGALYIGEKATMYYDRSGRPPRFFKKGEETAFASPPSTIPASKGHHRDWVDAIKGGPAASSHFEYGARLTEISLLGVLSLRLGGKKIFWDAENMKAKGLPEADVFIQEPVRSGWEM